MYIWFKISSQIFVPQSQLSGRCLVFYAKLPVEESDRNADLNDYTHYEDHFVGEHIQLHFPEYSSAPPTPTTLPHPLFIVSLWIPVILAEPVGWINFQEEKKPRQNWSRGHFEATQKANFQSWNQIFGQVTQRWASSAKYCKITILSGEILIFTSIVLGGFFANFLGIFA